jgi:alpha-beta hydrolase superfamily lysophospholipase
VKSFLALLPAAILAGCAIGPSPVPAEWPNPALDGALPLEEILGGRESFDSPGSRELRGIVPSGRYRIAASVLLPADPKGTLVIVHGYEASASAFVPVARAAAEAGFASVAVDLPGHGLSDGARDEIGSLSEYGDAVAAVAAACKESLPGPCLALGHSAGALAVFDASERRGGAVFDGMMLVAPLTRTAHWCESLFGYALVRPFARGLPDGNGGSVSLDWFGDLIAWRREAGAFPSISVPTLVLLGGKDGVVDNRDARKLLSAKLPGARFEVFTWMGHHDIESPVLDPRIAEAVIRFLDSARMPG